MRPASETGFTLIEVLVAVAILSFGMLGIAAMQITGVRANQGSYFRSQATFIASDFAERMYANRAGTRAGNYDAFDSNAGCGTVAASCSVNYADTVATNATGCTAPATAALQAAAMATFDRYYTGCGYPVTSPTGRLGGIRDMLPAGQIQVDCVSPDGTTVVACTTDLPAPPNPAVTLRRIRVSWSERIASSTGAAATATQTAQRTQEQTQTVTLVIQP